MENKIYEKWLKELQDELSLLDGLDVTPLERLKHALPIANKVITSVKEQVLKDGFTNQAEEIYFFKKIKPKFYALQLWETFYYSLCTQTPVGTKEMIKAFYEEELLQVLHFFRANSFHYQYFKTGASEMDHIYFLRDAQPSEIPVLELIDPFPGFSTSLDYSFAKFIVYERLRDTLLEMITNIYGENRKSSNSVATPSTKWTGDTINLVELGYGIWLTGQVNNGEAGVAEIIQVLETAFHVNVGRAYRRWQSISQRKRISPVKFLDQMRKAIMKKLEDEYQ
jgi:hypothetical protein